MTIEELMDYIKEGRMTVYAPQLMWMGVDHSRICDVTGIDMLFWIRSSILWTLVRWCTSSHPFPT